MTDEVKLLNQFESMLGWQQTKFIMDVAELLDAGSETVIAYTTTQRFREALARCKGEPIRKLDD